MTTSKSALRESIEAVSNASSGENDFPTIAVPPETEFGRRFDRNFGLAAVLRSPVE